MCDSLTIITYIDSILTELFLTEVLFTAGTKVKSRPVNVVGPLSVSTDYNNLDYHDSPPYREELFSGSGAESIDSDADHVTLQQDLIAQGKLISKLQHDLSTQLKVNIYIVA